MSATAPTAMMMLRNRSISSRKIASTVPNTISVCTCPASAACAASPVYAADRPERLKTSRVCERRSFMDLMTSACPLVSVNCAVAIAAVPSGVRPSEFASTPASLGRCVSRLSCAINSPVWRMSAPDSFW
jgi:hypothetical protein